MKITCAVVPVDPASSSRWSCGAWIPLQRTSLVVRSLDGGARHATMKLVRTSDQYPSGDFPIEGSLRFLFAVWVDPDSLGAHGFLHFFWVISSLVDRLVIAK